MVHRCIIMSLWQSRCVNVTKQYTVRDILTFRSSNGKLLNFNSKYIIHTEYQVKELKRFCWQILWPLNSHVSCFLPALSLVSEFLISHTGMAIVCCSHFAPFEWRWEYFMDYLGGLCSCNSQVLPGWRRSERSSCLRWQSTTPPTREWTGTVGLQTSALVTDHLKHANMKQLLAENRWVCSKKHKHTWVREVSLWFVLPVKTTWSSEVDIPLLTTF